MPLPRRPRLLRPRGAGNRPGSSSRSGRRPRPSAPSSTTPRRNRKMPQRSSQRQSGSKNWRTSRSRSGSRSGQPRADPGPALPTYRGRMSSGEQRDGINLTNLDQALSPDAGATKRDLVDYLDAVADRMLPGLAGRPLTVLRVLRGQDPFMQKNVPKYTPDWIRTVSIWADASKREVHYALCEDRRTLLWFANQRAIEYHPTHPSRARSRSARGRRFRRRGRRCTPRPPRARRLRTGWRGEDERRE